MTGGAGYWCNVGAAVRSPVVPLIGQNKPPESPVQRRPGSRWPQPGSAIEPGKGSIPVNPFLPSGAVARVAGYTADEARAK